MQKAFLILFAAVSILAMGLAWHCSNRVAQISADATAQISRLRAENRELRHALEGSLTNAKYYKNISVKAGKNARYHNTGF